MYGDRPNSEALTQAFVTLAESHTRLTIDYRNQSRDYMFDRFFKIRFIGKIGYCR
jgi:hypothetical protein